MTFNKTTCQLNDNFFKKKKHLKKLHANIVNKWSIFKRCQVSTLFNKKVVLFYNIKFYNIKGNTENRNFFENMNFVMHLIMYIWYDDKNVQVMFISKLELPNSFNFKNIT